MIKNIIFDIGGVLATSRSGYWFVTPKFWEILDKDKINIDELKCSMKNNYSMLTQTPKNEDEEYEMFSKFYYKILEDINYIYLSKNVADKLAYDCVFNDSKFLFYDDVKTILDILNKKYNLYIISNGWPSSFRVLKDYGIDKYFKGIMVSSMYSTIKEERLFDVFLDKYNGVSPNESLFIDDNINVLNKALEYGFNLIRMGRVNKALDSKFNTISSLKEIDKYL